MTEIQHSIPSDQPPDRTAARRRLLPWVCLWAVYVLLRIQLDINAGAFLFCFFDLFAFLAGIVWISTPRRRRLGGFLLACVLIGMPLSFVFVRIQMHFSIHRGDAVVAKIEQYHHDKGRYPEKLDDLIPAYIPEFPRHCNGWVGGRFRYFRFVSNVSQQETYKLSIVAAFGVCERGRYYLPELRRWMTIGA